MTVYLASMNRLGQKNLFFFFGEGIPAAIGQNICIAEKLKQGMKECE
jgi:hypothetical protein